MHNQQPEEVDLFFDLCVLLCRTRPSQKLKLRHLVVSLLKPHWLKTHLELCFWSDNQDQMASHYRHLHFFRSS